MAITVPGLSSAAPKCGFTHCLCNKSALKSFICAFKWSCCFKWQKLQVGEPLQLNDALLNLLGPFCFICLVISPLILSATSLILFGMHLGYLGFKNALKLSNQHFTGCCEAQISAVRPSAALGAYRPFLIKRKALAMPKITTG